MLRTDAATTCPLHPFPTGTGPAPVQSHQAGGYDLAQVPHSILEESLLQQLPQRTAGTGAPPAAVAGPRRFAPPAPVSVRIGFHLLSRRFKVIDDFSGSTFLSALRIIWLVKNGDGADETATTVPIIFAKADQPYIEIALLQVLLPLVIIAATGAVRNAKHGYYVVYPETVEALLEQQKAFIESLRRDSVLANGRQVPAATELELARLVSLHEAGVARFQRRQAMRKQGFCRLVGDNLRARRDDIQGNGDLSRAFVEEACAILDERLRRHRELPSEETAYQCELTNRREGARHDTKDERTALIATAFGMPLMGAGMETSTGHSAATAAANAAERLGNTAQNLTAQAVARGLEISTGVIMATAQTLQATSGALNLRLHCRARSDLKDDLSALKEMFDMLPPDVREVYTQDLAFRLRANVTDQAMAGGLVLGQGLMFVATIMSAFGGVSGTPLAVPGTVLTIGSAVGTGINESHKNRHVGDAAPDVVKADMHLGNLGDPLREEGHEAVTGTVGKGYREHQHDVVRTRVWQDITRMLEAEDILAPWSTRTPAERRDDLLKISLRWRGKARLLSDGQREMRRLIRDEYTNDWFDRPLLAIHEALRDEMAQNPKTAMIKDLPSFKREVLYATLDTLARRDDAMNSKLFRHPDGARRIRVFDDDFAARRKIDPVAYAAYLHHDNRILADYLVPGPAYGRAVHHTALTDLARGLRKHRHMAEDMESYPGEATTSV